LKEPDGRKTAKGKEGVRLRHLGRHLLYENRYVIVLKRLYREQKRGMGATYDSSRTSWEERGTAFKPEEDSSSFNSVRWECSAEIMNDGEKHRLGPLISP